MDWISRLSRLADDDGVVARAVLIATAGPTPRSVGASLLVTPKRQEGRIGRPQTTADVVSAARLLMARHRSDMNGPASETGRLPWLRKLETWRTGDVMGESSGGQVTVLIEVFGPCEIAELQRRVEETERADFLVRTIASGSPPDIVVEGSAGSHANARGVLTASVTRVASLAFDGSAVAERLKPKLTPFHVYGTGFVARALVRLLAELPFDVTWHDRAPAHFPEDRPQSVRVSRREAPAVAAAEAASNSFHAVMTNDHAADLEICRALARNGSFAFLGVIGAPLKRERLLARLAADGIEPAVLDMIACPIGLPGIRSKDPAVIAVSIAAQALTVLQRLNEESQDGAHQDGARL